MSIYKSFIDASFVLNSRVTKSRALSSEICDVYIKRDDELSAMISGSKMRKYAALIPYLKKNNISKCTLLGSSFSNNLVGLSQLLIENSIKPYVFTLESKNNKLCGNQLLLKMLIEPDQRFEIPRNLWHNRLEFVKNNFSRLSDSYVIDEGAEHVMSVIGSMTLGFDIDDNQKKLNMTFDQIFLDCGSGLSSIGFLISLNFLKIKPKVHIVSMALSKENFEKKYKFYLDKVGEKFNKDLFPYPFTFSRPQKHRSFGSVSRRLLDSLIKIVRSDGIFFDPIYSLKLYLEVKNFLEQSKPCPTILLIHSGGSSSILGFQESLSKIIKQEEPNVFSNN